MHVDDQRCFNVDLTLMCLLGSGKMYNRGIGKCKLIYEAIMRTVIVDHVEIGEDIYYQVDWRDDLDFETFWQEFCLQEKYNQFLHAREKLKNSKPLQKFCMSFLGMVELLLSTIHSISSGDWELLLKCIRKFYPIHLLSIISVTCVTFLSCFDTCFSFKMTLEMSTYEEFMGGKFAAQLTENSKFSRIETD